jgi:hypothetical protein
LSSRCSLLLVLLAAVAWPAHVLNIVHRAGTDDATMLDPHKVGYPGETTIMSDLFGDQTTLDIRATPIPGAARSWTVSADGRTRNGVAVCWPPPPHSQRAWHPRFVLDERAIAVTIHRTTA